MTRLYDPRRSLDENRAALARGERVESDDETSRALALLLEILTTMREQVAAINRLADANLALVDALVGDVVPPDLDDTEARPTGPTYLDGSPVR